jgi:hypothetical protein
MVDGGAEKRRSVEECMPISARDVTSEGGTERMEAKRIDVLTRDPLMADPQTDVSRPSALPSAGLLHRHLAKPQQSQSEKSSSEYLDSIEEEWNKKVDMDVETLVDGMVDIVSLASVS